MLHILFCDQIRQVATSTNNFKTALMKTQTKGVQELD